MCTFHLVVSTDVSNCGSIIRDTREYPTLDYTNSIGTDPNTIITYRESIAGINQYQSKFFVAPSISCTSAP